MHKRLVSYFLTSARHIISGNETLPLMIWARFSFCRPGCSLQENATSSEGNVAHWKCVRDYTSGQSAFTRLISLPKDVVAEEGLEPPTRGL